jgi:hypothetical protein
MRKAFQFDSRVDRKIDDGVVLARASRQDAVDHQLARPLRLRRTVPETARSAGRQTA